LITHEKNDSTFFAYTGKLTDNVSGLQWNINRWYDANVGRWMSEDPIGFAGRDMNLYRYAYNTPVTLLDPLGNTVSIRTEAECFLIDWLKEHSIKYGVNYVTLASISNKGYTNFYTMLGHSSVQYNNSIEKEIAYQMIKHTSKEFTIAGTDKNSSRDNWLGHISARKNIIFRANTAAFLFGGQGTGSHRGARQKNGVWEQFNGSIPSGFTAHDFAKHLANNQAQYSFYCQMGTAAVMFLGMFDTVTNSSLIANGETYFNSEVGGTSLGVALNVFYTNYTTGDDNFWIPGDAGYIANSAHSLSAPVSAGFEGENIIYLGSGSYWGHQTSGVKQSLAKWKNEVASWGTDGNGGGDIRGSKVDMKRFFPKFGIK
jgi:RHS repeat-associated protein